MATLSTLQLARLSSEVGDSVGAADDDTVGAAVGDTVSAVVDDSVDSAVGDDVDAAVVDSVRLRRRFSMPDVSL